MLVASESHCSRIMLSFHTSRTTKETRCWVMFNCFTIKASSWYMHTVEVHLWQIIRKHRSVKSACKSLWPIGLIATFVLTLLSGRVKLPWVDWQVRDSVDLQNSKDESPDCSSVNLYHQHFCQLPDSVQWSCRATWLRGVGSDLGFLVMILEVFMDLLPVRLAGYWSYLTINRSPPMFHCAVWGGLLPAFCLFVNS